VNTRSILIGIGIVSILIAAVIQVETDSAAKANETFAVSTPPTVVKNRADVVGHSAESPGVFFVRSESYGGEMIEYSLVPPRPTVRLPGNGKMSADRGHYLFARADGAENTIIEGFDVEKGTTERYSSLLGQWTVAAVSATARWAALLGGSSLVKPGSGEGELTRIDILDTRANSIVHAINLHGSFDVDAVSADGASLFLNQHIGGTGNDYYEIRVYDLISAKLLPDPVREKGADAVIQGGAIQQSATADGVKLLSVYLDTSRHVAFIHDLDLADSYPVSINLPSGIGNIDALRTYSLALSPDEKEVYAVNVALGVIVDVSLEVHAVVQTVGLGAYAPPIGANDQVGPSTNAAVVSQDGSRLFFADQSEIWAYDTASGKVTDSYQLATIIQGLGLNEAGTRLYVVTRADSVRTFIIPSDGTIVPLK
jgi:hypothetical protein